MSKTKGGGSTRNGRDSNAQRLGVKVFDGTGYATQRNIRNYDPRYLSVSMEFRSYDEDALLVLLVSDNQVRLMLICTQSVMGIL